MAYNDYNNNGNQNPMNGQNQNNGFQPPEYNAAPPQQQYNQYQYDSTYMQPKQSKGFDVASLVCGILSFFCCGVIASILAVVFACTAKSKSADGKFSGLALAGLICGIIGFVITIAGSIILIRSGTYQDILNGNYYYYS